MGCLGNLLWFVCGGFLSGLGWLLTGLLWCITIVGIPWGTQCFKFASLSFFPFGKEVEYGGGVGSLLLNILWLALSGIPMAVGSAIMGCILCATIVGIPLKAKTQHDGQPHPTERLIPMFLCAAIEQHNHHKTQQRKRDISVDPP